MTPPNQPGCLGLAPSFGFGDRIGLATPGHVAAMNAFGAGIEPIYPQQSIREMQRTGRSPEEVMQEAADAAMAAGWTSRFGADADHLKTPEDVDRTSAAGFTFYTIDPSDHVDEKADSYSADELASRFQDVKGEVDWLDEYQGRTETLKNGTVIDFTEEALQRAAVKYGRAIRHAVELAGYIRQVRDGAGLDYELELSVDETEQPTTLAEHWIIAEQCIKRGMKLVSLAPRFIGELEKGVDYIGDVEALEASLHDHNAVAEALGPYKLSLHSGSDKISMYTVFARATQGKFHVKTAGTSYLEALRVVAIEEPDFFRQLCGFSRDRYLDDKATYHVHATLEGVPSHNDLPGPLELESVYLERWEDVPEGKGFTEAGRQILHCTFGSVLTHPEYSKGLRACLEKHPQTYASVLQDHFGRHLDALKKGMNG